MIFNLVKKIEWPNEHDKRDLVLGVYGDDNVYHTLKTAYENKSKGERNLIVTKLSSAEGSPICDVFFLGDAKLKDFQKVKTLIHDKPVLLITSAPSYGQKGSAVNLYQADGRMTIEINLTITDQAGFKIPGSLLSMAKLIR
jgi:hypothetical protein